MIRTICCSALVALPMLVIAAEEVEEEEKDLSKLTLERIYESEDFDSKSYSGRWLENESAWLRLEEPEDDGAGKNIVKHHAENEDNEIIVAAENLVPPGESRPLSIDGYQWTDRLDKFLIYTNSKKVWRAKTRGDYWVFDRTSLVLRKLGGDAKPSSLMFATFSPDGDLVAYVRENDLYVEDMHDGKITRLTKRESKHIINGTFDWVYEEEFRLRKGFRWRPDSRAIAFWQLDTRNEPEFVMINNTDGLYPKLTRFKYPKAGGTNPVCRVGIRYLDTGPKTPPRWISLPGDPAQHYIADIDWINDETLVLQQLNRLQNTNRVFLAKTLSGKIEVILTEKEKTWVEEPKPIDWFENEDDFIWISERDGWRHPYLASRNGGGPKRLGDGKFDITSWLRTAEARNSGYAMASPGNAAERYLYHFDLGKFASRRVTPKDQPGSHSYSISPDGRHAFHTWSTRDKAPVTNLVSLPDHKSMRKLEDNEDLRETFEKVAKQPAEFFEVEIEPGVSVDAFCLKPPSFDPAKKYPLIVYVYGEPVGQTVVNRWGGKGNLWHLMLAQQGYIVMSFDNRGSPAPKGRKWRKAAYRKVGVLSPKDQAAALRRVLKDRPYLDPDRVGVWGWSGGGSMTLHAMFKFPDLYKAGISIAAVPNQRHYDTIYMERYHGLPSENPVGYREGSPIHHAQHLEGKLLIIHGTGDDNCHYQGAETLINKLIRKKKQFEMFAYPNRSHSISEGKNTDIHLRRMMTDFFLRNLPPKASL